MYKRQMKVYTRCTPFNKYYTEYVDEDPLYVRKITVISHALCTNTVAFCCGWHQNLQVWFSSLLNCHRIQEGFSINNYTRVDIIYTYATIL